MPMTDLIDQTQAMAAEMVSAGRRATIEAVLKLSADKMAAPPHPGEMGRCHGRQWMGSFRVPVFLCIAPILLLTLMGRSAIAAEHQVVFIAGGDVAWSLYKRPPSVLYHIVDPSPFGQLLDVRDQAVGDWGPVPYLNQGESKAYVESLSVKQRKLSETRFMIDPEFTDEMALQPLAPTLQAADLVYFNLETPLSDHARMDGMNRTPEKFAATLRSAGTSLVSVANNHTFDAEGQGFLDTLRALSSAGVPYIGGGNDLAEARKPVILERNGIKFGFLGYAQFSNMGEAAFAAEGRPGIAPMDPFIIREDIRRLRPLVDYVVVALHWSTATSVHVSPANRIFAHDLIDDGADIILGGHPPFPKGIEVYRGKVIIYSPGVTLRGFNHSDWGNHYLVRFTLGAKSVEKVEVLPIAGTGKQIAQPSLLHGSAAQQLLESIRSRSASLDTTMEIYGDLGIISMASPRSSSTTKSSNRLIHSPPN
jgi:poly-gamma-glutamate synthesis protein (capsule biosynthesis protein)